MQQGDVVAGEVTLDMCGATFRSETFRTARHQVAFGPGSARQLPVSNEVVAYDSPARAAMAMAEIRHAAAHCPKGPVTSSVASMPATVQRATVLPKSAQLPASSIRLAMTATDPKTGKSLRSELVFTVRGTVLSGTYVLGLGAAPAALAVRLAHTVALRLTKAIALN
jgi:hypothetical protein